MKVSDNAFSDQQGTSEPIDLRVVVTAASTSRARPERRLNSLLVEFDGDIELTLERLYLSSRQELLNTPGVRCWARGALVRCKRSA